MMKMTFNEKENFENLVNDLFIAEDLFKIQSEYFYRLDGVTLHSETNQDKIAEEWYILKNNFDEHKALSETILKKYEDIRETLQDLISQIKTNNTKTEE